jgi:hypothetical protein
MCVFMSVTKQNSSILHEFLACCAPTSEVLTVYTRLFFMTGIENGQRWYGLRCHVFRFYETYLEIQNFIWKRQVDGRVRLVLSAMFIK